MFLCAACCLRQTERFPHKPFIAEMRNATALVGGSVTFACSVISDLTPFVQWYKHYTNDNGSYVNDTTGQPYLNSLQVSTVICVNGPIDYVTHRMIKMKSGKP